MRVERDRGFEVAFLLSAIAGLSCVALPRCVLPPEEDRNLSINAAPTIDYSYLDPAEPVTVIRPSCPLVDVGLRVFDVDSPYVGFRWVANNATTARRHLRDDQPRKTEGFEVRGLLASFSTKPAHYDGDRGAPIGVLSLFVTDAIDEDPTEGPIARWAISDPSVSDPTESPDLGGIDPPDQGPRANVVEVRWTFQFLDSGGCR